MTMIKAFVLAFLGIMVCAGIISSFAAFLVLGTLPHEDIIAGVVFSVLAGAVIATSLRAMLRVNRQGGTGPFEFLARAVQEQEEQPGKPVRTRRTTRQTRSRAR